MNFLRQASNGLLPTFLLTFGTVTIAQAATINDQYVFSTDNQSMWNTGSSFKFSRKDFLGFQWDEKLGPAAEFTTLFDTLSLKILEAQSKGKIGFESVLELDSGSVKANIPVDFFWNIPDRVVRGQTFSVDSTWKFNPSSTFSTSSPDIKYQLDLIANFTAQIDFLKGNFGDTQFNVGIPIKHEHKTNILKLGTAQDFKIKLPLGIGKINVKVPKVETKGSLVKGSKNELISDIGKDKFVDLSLDVDKIITTIFKAPDLSKKINEDLDYKYLKARLKAEYSLLDLGVGADLVAEQQFKLQGNIGGALKLGENQVPYSSNMQFTVPETAGDHITIEGLLDLNSVLKNQTGFGVDFKGNIEVGKFSADLKIPANQKNPKEYNLRCAVFFNPNRCTSDRDKWPSLLSQKVGPLFKIEGPFYKTPRLNVYDESFALKGFNFVPVSFKIPVVDQLPEMDFGDAPDSYRTLLNSQGPRYEEGEEQRLGILWDAEKDGQPTPLANGDDLSLLGGLPKPVDDEDGVIFGKNWVDISLTITRSGTNRYLLRAWWDLNRNGFFDHPGFLLNPNAKSELIIDDWLTLEAGSYTKRYMLGFDPQNYYSRFRLTWEPIDPDVKPWGEYISTDGISHGEVEDYPPSGNVPPPPIPPTKVPEPTAIPGLITFVIVGMASKLIKMFFKHLLSI